jgi:hypothetical protein
LLGAEPARTFVRVEPSAPVSVQGSAPACDGGAEQQRLMFPNGLVLEWQGAADLRLIGQLLRLEDARP